MRVLYLVLAGLLPLLTTTAVADDYVAAAKGVSAVAKDARILVLGELHGTKEIPVLTAELARLRLSSGPVLLALEIPAQEQDRMNRYLDSNGSDANRQHLLQGKFWQRDRDRSDGRRSLAMVGLFETLRQLHQDGGELTAVAFDNEDFHDGRDRDAAMATALLHAHQASPEAQILVLTGNYHARRTKSANAFSKGKRYYPPEPMVRQLLGLIGDTPLININVSGALREFWGCQESCGPITLPPRPDADTAPAFALEQGNEVYDFHLTLAELTSSAPTPVP